MLIEYSYELKTLKQKELIDLTQYKMKLEHATKNFLEDSFVSIEIDKKGYSLKLNQELKNTQKRNLGKYIVKETGLKEYLTKYIYNNGKEKSTQLFRITKTTFL